MFLSRPEIDFEEQPNDAYVFEGLTPFYYKFENDSLKLFIGRESEIPKNFKSKIKIIQIVLLNPEMTELDANYEKEKLIKLR